MNDMYPELSWCEDCNKAIAYCVCERCRKCGHTEAHCACPNYRIERHRDGNLYAVFKDGIEREDYERQNSDTFSGRSIVCFGGYDNAYLLTDTDFGDWDLPEDNARARELIHQIDAPQ